jgi:mRNA interferase RelE/StbE
MCLAGPTCKGGVKGGQYTKKIEGYETYYRIRIGDYRLGMEAISGREVVLLRFLHRKDIYRYFPKRG